MIHIISADHDTKVDECLVEPPVHPFQNPVPEMSGIDKRGKQGRPQTPQTYFLHRLTSDVAAILFPGSVQPSIISPILFETGSDILTLFRTLVDNHYPQILSFISYTISIKVHHQAPFYIFQKSHWQNNNKVIPQIMDTNSIKRCYIFNHLQVYPMPKS